MIDEKIPAKWKRPNTQTLITSESEEAPEEDTEKETETAEKVYNSTYDLAPLLKPIGMMKLYITILCETEVDVVGNGKFNFDNFITQSMSLPNFNELVTQHCTNIAIKCQEVITSIDSTTHEDYEEDVAKHKHIEGIWNNLIKTADPELFELCKKTLNFGSELYSTDAIESHTKIDGMINQIAFTSMFTPFHQINELMNELHVYINQATVRRWDQTSELADRILNSNPEILALRAATR